LFIQQLVFRILGRITGLFVLALPLPRLFPGIEIAEEIAFAGVGDFQIVEVFRLQFIVDDQAVLIDRCADLAGASGLVPEYSLSYAVEKPLEAGVLCVHFFFFGGFSGLRRLGFFLHGFICGRSDNFSKNRSVVSFFACIMG